MGSYVRLIDFVYHSTLGLRVIKKKKFESFIIGGWPFGGIIVLARTGLSSRNT